MKKLLFISHRMPYPPDKGERVRAFHEIKELSQKFEVTVVGLCHNEPDFASAEGLAKFCHAVVPVAAGRLAGLMRGAASKFCGGSVTEGYFISQEAIETVKSLGRFDVGVGYSSGVLELLEKAAVDRRVMDMVDVDSAKWDQYAKSHRLVRKFLYAGEAKAVRKLERRAIESCDRVFVVSQAEAALLGDIKDRVQCVANGVECDYFSPDVIDSFPLGEKSLVFTGSMNYRPNAEGVIWFVESVFRELKHQLPSITFTIVGRDPIKAVRQLGKLQGVRVTGTVEDVRPYLKGADVAVCPLLIGRGIQNKLLEAMAMAKPVVATPDALEGIDIGSGEELLVAQSPQQWVESLLYLFNNRDRISKLGQKARDFVLAEYSWQARLKPFVEACEG